MCFERDFSKELRLCRGILVISVWEGNFELPFLQQIVHKKKQVGLVFRSVFGQMISPKQIMLCFCHLFEGKLDVNIVLCGLPQAKPSLSGVISADPQAAHSPASLMSVYLYISSV